MEFCRISTVPPGLIFTFQYVEFNSELEKSSLKISFALTNPEEQKNAMIPIIDPKKSEGQDFIVFMLFDKHRQVKKYDLTIIIVTFNSEKYIDKCIDSIAISEKNEISYKIIIIDNYSKDETVNKIKKIQKDDRKIYLIENKKNIGFARAVNQGISRDSGGGYVLLLNPDTILEKRSLINLIKCAEKNQAGVCGGTTIDNHGKISGSYFRFPSLMIGLFDFTNLRKLLKNDQWHKHFYCQDENHGNKTSFPVDVVTGGFMLINKSTIKEIGLFDESFFMYLEDVDYCLRAKKAGIRIFHTNGSKILHIGGASSNNDDRVRHSSWLKSRKIYYAKHFGIFENMMIQPIFLLDDLLILIMKTLKSISPQSKPHETNL